MFLDLLNKHDDNSVTKRRFNYIFINRALVLPFWNVNDVVSYILDAQVEKSEHRRKERMRKLVDNEMKYARYGVGFDDKSVRTHLASLD